MSPSVAPHSAGHAFPHRLDPVTVTYFSRESHPLVPLTLNKDLFILLSPRSYYILYASCLCLRVSLGYVAHFPHVRKILYCASIAKGHVRAGHPDSERPSRRLILRTHLVCLFERSLNLRSTFVSATKNYICDTSWGTDGINLVAIVRQERR